jgi:hypothetical protein
MTQQSGLRDLLIVVAGALALAILSTAVARSVAGAVAQARGISPEEIEAMTAYVCFPISALAGGAAGALLAVIGERRWLLARYAAVLGVIALAAALLGFLLSR